MSAARAIAWSRLALVLIAACAALVPGCNDPEDPGAWVPPTADRDPALPRVAIELDGKRWWLHLQTFGAADLPPVFVLPGGPGADYRLLLPLRALQDRYFVVFWDLHGAGLSQRANQRDELDLASFDREIGLVRERLAPARKITLIGHSFGGSLAARYAARHPDDVAQLVLIEPGPLTPAARAHRHTAWLTLSSAQSVFWDNEVITAADHVAADYRLLGALRSGTRGFYCDGQQPEEDPIWRFSAFALEMVPRNEGDVSYARGIDAFGGPILVVAGSCGELGAGFQRRWQVPALDHAELAEVPDAGHISLFLEHRDETVGLIAGWLDARRQEP